MRPAFSQQLADSLGRATRLAEEQNRKFATPEDLLIALIDDPDAAGVMSALLVDPQRLRRDLTAYMKSARDDKDDSADPQPDRFRIASDLAEILQQTLTQIRTSGRDVATGADVLVELFGEPCGHFLQQQGASYYDATRYVSHGIRKDDPSPTSHAHQGAPGSSARVELLNDNYTPMEFVVYVLEHMFGMENEPARRLMLEIHEKGAAICGIYPFNAAQAKVTEVLDFARRHQHPLQCVLVNIANTGEQ